MAVNESEDKMDVAGAFGEASEPVMIGGRRWLLRELDLNDMIVLQQRVGGIESLNLADMEHMRLVWWLILRKSDDRLTAEELEAGEYRLTEEQIGRLVKLGDSRNVALIDQVMKRSGFLPQTAGTETEEGNAAAGDAGASASPSPA